MQFDSARLLILMDLLMRLWKGLGMMMMMNIESLDEFYIRNNYK